MKLKMLFLVLAGLISTQAMAGVLANNDGSTGNVADWDGVANTLDSGRWSYLYRDATNTGSNLKPLEYQYSGGGGNFVAGSNWCYSLGAAQYNYTSSMQKNGAIRTGSNGSRSFAFAYRFDAADAADGKFSFTAKFDNAPFWVSSQLAVFMISSANINTSTSEIDFGTFDGSTGAWSLSSGVSMLYDSTYKSYGGYAVLPSYTGTDVAVSEGDMLVVMDVRNSDYTADWPTVATITAAVPEPSTMCLLAVCGLAVLRRKK